MFRFGSIFFVVAMSVLALHEGRGVAQEGSVGLLPWAPSPHSGDSDWLMTTVVPQHLGGSLAFRTGTFVGLRLREPDVMEDREARSALDTRLTADLGFFHRFSVGVALGSAWGVTGEPVRVSGAVALRVSGKWTLVGCNTHGFGLSTVLDTGIPLGSSDAFLGGDGWHPTGWIVTDYTFERVARVGLNLGYRHHPEVPWGHGTLGPEALWRLGVEGQFVPGRIHGVIAWQGVFSLAERPSFERLSGNTMAASLTVSWVGLNWTLQGGYRLPGGPVTDGYFASFKIGWMKPIVDRCDGDDDGDNVMNCLDRCPAEAGLRAFDGCPDADDDGVYEPLDRCSMYPGSEALYGCPDSDGDGVPNAQDLCPAQLGAVADRGCPDLDGDGIPEHLDHCPKEKGSVEGKGCPDEDHDGVQTSRDRCPDAPGEVRFLGCPDGDGDGVPDVDDVCPRLAGPAVLDGCPAPKRVMDEVLQLARRVLFGDGVDILDPSSYSVLDRMANLLKANAGLGHIALIGYCDAREFESEGGQACLRRVRTVREFLVTEGVEAARLQAVNGGVAKGPGDNRTVSGRRLNRRIELRFIPVVEGESEAPRELYNP